MHILKMYLSLYKFKTRHHLYNNTRRALASSRVDLLSNQWSYQVNTGCHCYYLWDSATNRFMAWHGHDMGNSEWSFSNGSLHVDGYNFNRFSRVAATGTYSFQYPDFEGMRRNNILKKWEAVHLIIVTMLGLPLRDSQHQIISINMVV